MKLYPCQLEAINKMHNGCILCGEVGSGKSLTALGFYYLLQQGSMNYLIGGDYHPMVDPPQKLYIITTARKRDTLEWEGELINFYYSGEVNSGGNMYAEAVTIDSWNNIGKYADVKNAFFIFDEQRVVGSGAWVKSFLKICKSNEWILLSATPGDTWSDYIPVFIANGFYKNKTEFNREHVIFNRFAKFPMVDRYINTGRLQRLRNGILVNIDMERNTEEHHLYIKCQHSMPDYKQILKDRWNPWNNEPIENASELCYCLRKVLNSDGSRIAQVKDIVKRHKKVIVFYNFDYELEILKEADYGKGVKIAEWNGHKHQDIPVKADSWVYLVQYNAGAEGWNCTLTDTMVFYSQTYSYKQLHQACGRINRMNTPFHDLYYYHLVSTGNIDLAIKSALRNKKKFNEGKYAKGV